MFLCTLPIQLSRVFDNWGYTVRKSDKELQFALGFRTAPDLSKAKHGSRPFDVRRIFNGVDAGTLTPAEAVAFFEECIALVGGQRTDRDLVQAIVTRLAVDVDEIKRWLGVHSPIKAEKVSA